MATTGFGVLETNGGRPRVLAQGVFTTLAGEPLPERLVLIHRGISNLCKKHRVDEVAVEELFFQKNVRSAIAVAHARGTILLSAGQAGARVYEYTPQQVKVALTGYGGAEKKQVQNMVQRVLALKEIPRPDDCADALAIAVCHAQNRNSRDRYVAAGVAPFGHVGRGQDPPTARRLVAKIQDAVKKEELARRSPRNGLGQVALRASPPRHQGTKEFTKAGRNPS